MIFKRSPKKLKARREQLLAELADCQERLAWFRASDDPFELAEARAWRSQVDALERALEKLELEIFRAELDEL